MASERRIALDVMRERRAGEDRLAKVLARAEQAEARLAAVVSTAKALSLSLDLLGTEIEDAAETDSEWERVSLKVRLLREVILAAEGEP
jgi:hypothetical protein